MIRIFLVSLVVIFLTGCGGFETTRVVEKQKLIAIELDARLLEPCITPPPPDKEYYMSLNISDREVVLTKYSVSLMKNLSKCGKQVDEIKIAQEKTIEELRKGINAKRNR